MQVLVGTLFTLFLVSCCSCHKLSKGVVKQTNFNVEDYGAVGDATTDDSLVNVVKFSSLIIFIVFVFFTFIYLISLLELVGFS